MNKRMVAEDAQPQLSYGLLWAAAQAAPAATATADELRRLSYLVD